MEETLKNSVKIFFVLIYLISISFLGAKTITYKISFGKSFEGNREFESKAIWINYPIKDGYRFVSNKDFSKIALSTLNKSNLKKPLKISEWQINSSKIRFFFYDKTYYQFSFDLSQDLNRIIVMVKHAKTKKYGNGQSIIWEELEPYIFNQEFSINSKVIIFKLKNTSYFFTIRKQHSIKPLADSYLYNVTEFQKYILVQDKFLSKTIIPGTSKSFTRIIVNLKTNLYGTTKSVDLISGSRNDFLLIKKYCEEWGFDVLKPRINLIYRTEFFY